MRLDTVRPTATDQLHASREDSLRARAAGGDETVERRHAWAARFRRLARDDAQLAETLAGLHCVAFAILMLKRVMALMV